MTTVMAFGSFDVLHPGHIYFLEESKKLGGRLVVVIARDSAIMEVKGFAPKYNQAERLEHLRDLKIAHRVILGYESDKYKVIEDINPDVIALGYDQKTFTGKLREEMEKRKMNPIIVRIGPYKESQYKSSKLR